MFRVRARSIDRPVRTCCIRDSSTLNAFDSERMRPARTATVSFSQAAALRRNRRADRIFETACAVRRRSRRIAAASRQRLRRGLA